MERKPVTSTNIKSIGYENGTLEIEFRDGGVYEYSVVSEEIYKEFIVDSSIGSYFNRNIKNYFTAKKIS